MGIIKIFKLIRKKPLYDLFRVFYKEIILGFHIYLKIRTSIDNDTTIILCSPRGTGDIYVIGQYFREFLKKNNICKYEFIFRGKSEQKIGKLYGIYGSLILDDNEVWLLNRFIQFVGNNNLKIIELHHYAYPIQAHANSIYFEGYRGWTFENLIKRAGMKLGNDVLNDLPQYICVESIREKFNKKGLIPNKTVILAPFSSSAYILDYQWWYKLAHELKKAGYTVATNVVEEKEILGTVPIEIKYEELKSYLECAGYFIAARSGLCDIVSGIDCKKIVLTPYWDSNLPWQGQPGKTLQFYGMEKNYNDKKTFEFEYNKDVKEKLLVNILNLFSNNFNTETYTYTYDRSIQMRNSKYALVYFVEKELSKNLKLSIESAISNNAAQFDIYIFTCDADISVYDIYEKKGNIQIIDFDSIYKREIYGIQNVNKKNDIFLAIIPFILSNYEKIIYASEKIIFNVDLFNIINTVREQELFSFTDDLAYRAYINENSKKIRNNYSGVQTLISNNQYPNIDLVCMHVNNINQRATKEEWLSKILRKYNCDVSAFWVSEYKSYIHYLPQKYNCLMCSKEIREYFCENIQNEQLYEDFVDAQNEIYVYNFRNYKNIDMENLVNW